MNVSARPVSNHAVDPIKDITHKNPSLLHMSRIIKGKTLLQLPTQLKVSSYKSGSAEAPAAKKLNILEI